MKKTSSKKHCSCGTSCACKNCVCGPHAAFFETLGNEGRLYIIHALRAGPQTVTDITNATRMEQTLVSHNLKRLEACGFVKADKEGKYRKYSLNIQIEPLFKLIDKHAQEYCAPEAKDCCCGGKK